MSRKRTQQPTNTSTENNDTSTTSTATIEAPATETPQASAEPLPEAAATTEVVAQSFVERIQRERQKSSTPDPFGIAGDYVAGVRLFEDREKRLMAIKFDEKPSQEILDKLKDAGFRWNPRDKVWVNPIRPETARATRIEAERTYQEVRSIIRQEKGIESGPEIPF